MVKDSQELLLLLKSLRLFAGLDDAQIELVAAVAEVVELVEGQSLSLPPDRDYPFYLIKEGKVRQIRQLSNGKIELRSLKRDDFFGAEILLVGGRRNYRIEALQKTTLLMIESAQFALLLRGIPTLRNNVREQLLLNRLLRRKIFNFLGEDESVYLIVRQHPAFLFVSLIRPIIIAWFGVLIFVFSTLIGASSLRLVVGWIALGFGIVAALWALWVVLDWLNDYYIITDRRVINLNRIILLYESRREAPLTAVKSEEVKTSFLGRMLGFGDVITYAFMGQVVFRGIADPRAVREIIEGLRKLTALSLMEADRQTMESLIRRKIDPPPEPPPSPPETVPIQRRRARRLQQAVPFRLRFRQLFQTYKDEGGVITYRKHILILVKKTWIPGLFIAFILAASIYVFIQNTIGDWTYPPFLILSLMTFTILIPFTVWWLYQYVDWSNDIYQITDEKIIDSEKKPLGTEITKSAPLENILSLDYELIGFWGRLFNLGNVIINTGTDKLTWMTITDPGRAQREIFNRMFEQRRRKQLNDARNEWDQVSDWLAAYHRQAEDLRRTQNQPPI